MRIWKRRLKRHWKAFCKCAHTYQPLSLSYRWNLFFPVVIKLIRNWNFRKLLRIFYNTCSINLLKLFPTITQQKSNLILNNTYPKLKKFILLFFFLLSEHSFSAKVLKKFKRSRPPQDLNLDNTSMKSITSIPRRLFNIIHQITLLLWWRN